MSAPSLLSTALAMAVAATTILIQAEQLPAQSAPADVAHHPAVDSAAPPAFQVERHGGGRPMILIPGLLSSGEVWGGTVERFAVEYDIHVLTLAGFAGAPTTDSDPFLETTRDAIIQYIRDEGLERPVLMGHSLGGFLALWIAATTPELAGPVVAVDGVPFLAALGDTTMTPDGARPQADGIRGMFGAMSRDALGAQTRMAMSAQVGDTAWHRIGGEWGAASDPTTVGRAVAEMLTTDIRSDVARIHTPVLLFLAGSGLDEGVRATALDRYRGQIAAVPDARVVVAEDARHFIMLDDPAFFHATVESFLERR